MKQKLEIPLVTEKTGLVVIAHADDLALFCGAAVIALVDQGWKLHVIRATDDRWDSWGLNEEDTIDRNQAEFESALKQFGIENFYDLQIPTDQLADYSEVTLRNRIVSLMREIKPYLVLTFDPDSIKFEDNEDHRLVARATTEACWTSGFDKHPDGKVDQLKPHLPIERWYFGRTVVDVTHQLEISPYRERLVNVVAEHRTMLLNMVSQLEVKAKLLGFQLERLRSEVERNPRYFAQLIVDKKDVENYRVIDSKEITEVIERFGEKL